ncbi:MAG: two-component system response regulator [Dehalococcoidales bacterium]
MAKTYEINTVLIIEDEVDVRNFAARVLELEGYQVLQAEDVDTGLRLAKENRVALVLLDLRLPNRSGWAVLVLMKNEPDLSSIPIIVFTASAGVTQRERALNMGAADYLVKPLSAASLKTAVNNILQTRR